MRALRGEGLRLSKTTCSRSITMEFSFWQCAQKSARNYDGDKAPKNGFLSLPERPYPKPATEAPSGACRHVPIQAVDFCKWARWAPPCPRKHLHILGNTPLIKSISGYGHGSTSFCYG